MDVYFDNNALNDLHGLRDITRGEVDRLRAAAKDRVIVPKLSFDNVDEALAALVNHRPLALELLRLIADFYGLDRLIKPPDKAPFSTTSPRGSERLLRSVTFLGRSQWISVATHDVGGPPAPPL